jgi:secondary thiamine-phosphate synthase enzyme
MITVKTSKRNEIIDITSIVEDAVAKSKVKVGICTVFCPHTTAALTINENADPNVKHDILAKLSRMIPEHENYSNSEGNSDAHIKASLVGNSVSVIVEDGKLMLGTWQGIMFCEFDGPRSRNVYIYCK